MKEVYLYKKLKNNLVRCDTCAHRCVIAPGKRGICGVRENHGNKLFALNYGKVIARHIDPIEKKPLFHFLPGTPIYSIATAGCNLDCKNCQNWDISQMPKIPHTEKAQKPNIIISGENFTPEEIIEYAVRNKCPSIAYTYTEPTIFIEFALDTMKIARQKGLKNVWVSNGFMTEESAKLVIPYLDANNIDIKGFGEDFYRENCGARLQPVLDTAKLMKKSGVWVEITTLAIPGLSDSGEMFRKISKFIHNELGAETPWHISQFSGAISWKLQHIPKTPIETLEMAYKIGKKMGLKYVYIGNIPGLPNEDTYCPKCQALAINRFGYSIKRRDKDGKCRKCSENLDLTVK